MRYKYMLFSVNSIDHHGMQLFLCSGWLYISLLCIYTSCNLTVNICAPGRVEEANYLRIISKKSDI